LIFLDLSVEHAMVEVDVEQKVIEPIVNPQSSRLDLAASVKGMYRLLDLINESGSNGYGEEPS
jgi:hypothetical protein